MNLTSRLQGYTNHQIAYPNPIPHLPQPKTLHDKKDTTLLQMAMKAFLKQRLYGRFHNFDILNKNNRNHLKHRNSVGENYSKQEKSEMNINNYNNTGQLARNSKNHSAMQHTHPHSYQTSIPNKSSKLQSFIKESKTRLRQSSLAQQNEKQKLNITQQRRLSQISSSLDMKSKRFQQNNTQLTNHTVKESINQSLHSKVLNIPSKTLNVRQSLDNVRHLNHQQGQYHGSSFISAVDFNYDNQHLQGNGQNRYEEDIKLPLITDRKKLNKNLTIVNNSNTPKPSKVLFKKQIQPSATIADDLWTFISEPRRQRNRKQQNQSKINKNQTPSTETNNLISLSKPSTLKMSNEQIKNSSIVTKANEHQNLNKESFMSFIQNQKLCIPTFVSSILNFFELNSKIVDKCQKNDFENIFASAYKQHDRAWCIAIFRFLDQNLDGQIDSSDLFKLHNFLEQIKTKIQSGQHDYIDQSIVNKPTKKESSPKRSQRQKTQLSQTQDNKDKTRNKTKILNSPKQKTNQSEKYSEQSLQTMSNLKNKNEENVKQMLKQIQKFNLKLLQKDKQLQKAQDQNNPQKSLYSKDQKIDSQILYLEEALLKNKQLKLSDLNLIFEQLSYQNTKTKKKVIDIDYKKLNIKLSSSYVQTFIATNHNQETRLNRQYLEGLKDYIKQQSHQSKDILDVWERKNLPSIKYSEFYEDKLFLPLKNVFFDMFQAQISLKN